jgi:hypothetical protein
MGSLKNAFKKLKVLGKSITSTGCHPAAVRTITEKSPGSACSKVFRAE